MDGKGRALDNIFIERLWRSVKYEFVYPMKFTSVQEAREYLNEYFEFYNNHRLHQSLGYKTPAEIYLAK
jgi:putative transposase